MTRAVAHRPTYELRRSRTDRKIGGVLGGFAKHFDIDPTLLRVGYLLSAVLSAAFPGVLVYLVLWLIIPAEWSTWCCGSSFRRRVIPTS